MFWLNIIHANSVSIRVLHMFCFAKDGQFYNTLRHFCWHGSTEPALPATRSWSSENIGPIKARTQSLFSILNLSLQKTTALSPSRDLSFIQTSTFHPRNGSKKGETLRYLVSEPFSEFVSIKSSQNYHFETVTLRPGWIVSMKQIFWNSSLSKVLLNI